jgi:hypothetical protein
MLLYERIRALDRRCAVAPKFDLYLNFEGIDEIEACGPTNFAPGDESARIVRVRIKQEGGPAAVYERNLGAAPPVAATEPMWEIEFDRGQLVPGSARAQGEAVVFRSDGTRRTITWVSDVTLVDTASFVTFGAADTDPGVDRLIEG